MHITRIIEKGETMRLTKDVHGAPGFTAGTLVKIEDVRFAPMTPPQGMAAENYLSATYKIAIYEDVQVRENVGVPISSDRVPHAHLSKVQGGTASSHLHMANQELFLITPFQYKHRGATLTLPVGTPVGTQSSAMTNKGSPARRPETAMYTIRAQRIVTRQRPVARAGPVPKIYFE